jgi:glutaredoxin-related protein
MESLPHVHPSAALARANFHPDVVNRVRDSVERDAVVIVGMAGNAFVRRARNLLTEQGVPFTYLEFGGYFSQWRERLAIKLWAQWPTFPMVFVRGSLVGGFKELEALARAGELEHLVRGSS